MSKNIKTNNYKTNNLITEYSNLFFFWWVGVFYFFLFRISFIFIYRDDLVTNINFTDYGKALFQGFRFDMTAVSYFILLPLFSSFFLIPLGKEKIQRKIRVICQWIFVFTSAIISIITLNYYGEYNEQFNYFLFMGLHDDQNAVFQSIINDFHPILNTISIISLIYLLSKTFRHFENKKRIADFINSFQFKYRGIIVSILVIILFVGSIRASFTNFPARREYTAVTADDFLNKTIMNPIRSLNYAISDYKKLTKVEGNNPFGEMDKTLIKSNSIQELIHHKNTLDNFNNPPKQIFLIVMESYDSWCLNNPVLTDLGVNASLRNIESKGLSFTHFVPSANTTMDSFSSIVTTIPHTGVNMSLKGATNSYPSSIFNQFKELGYETNFFYAGFSSWQNIKNFTSKQGAENIYCAGEMNGKVGIWGVNDDALFSKVLEKVDPTKKSINVILTLSYHSPYEVDLKKEKYRYLTKNDLPKDKRNIYDEKQLPLKVLGHLWYSDKEIGEFVKQAEKKYPTALFSFTGDHWGRKFLDNKTTCLKDKNSVPFILYGKPIENHKGKSEIAGSHIDITPTLLQFVMPKNHEYYSFGNSLFQKNKEKSIGIGFDKAINYQLIEEFTEQGNKTQCFNQQINKDFKKHRDSILSIAWHYIMKGDALK